MAVPHLATCAPVPSHPAWRHPQELFPGNFAPTPAHVFMKLLLDKGLLLRVCEHHGLLRPPGTQDMGGLQHGMGPLRTDPTSTTTKRTHG